MTTSCCAPCYAGLARLVPRKRPGKQDHEPDKQEQHIGFLRSSTVTDALTKRVEHHVTLSPMDLTTVLLKNDPQRPFRKEYQLQRQLGTGAFGTVYQAQSVLTNDVRAVKVISKAAVKDELAGLVTEMEALMKLCHPNVLTFYEFFETKKCICLVTELCDGGDFHKLYKSKAPEDEVRMLFRDVTMAVAYCHDEGICHRDLKLENCLISQTPSRRIAKVIDFGLAAIRREDQNQLAWLEEALGTKYFVAPEVLDTSVRYGTSCDCWSLGVMIYIVITNQHPFAKDAATLPTKQLFNKIRTEKIRTEPLAKGASKMAKTLIEKLLQRDVKKRMTAKSALDQEWLRPKYSRELSLEKAWGKKRTGEMLERLSSFGHTTPFEKVVRMLVAHNAKLADMETMRTAFVALDTHGDGSLEKAELEKGLRDCGMKMSDKEISEAFEVLDFNHNHRINYYEWMAVFMDTRLLQVDSAMKELFHFLDRDNSGTISKEEFSMVVNDEEARRVIEEIDTSHDGLVDWEEFKAVMQKMGSRKA